jgi:hypothetical protein
LHNGSTTKAVSSAVTQHQTHMYTLETRAQVLIRLLAKESICAISLYILESQKMQKYVDIQDLYPDSTIFPPF